MAGARLLKLLIIESTPDRASGTIASQLRRAATWETTNDGVAGIVLEHLRDEPQVALAKTDLLHLHAEALEDALHAAGLQPRTIVFLSKHKAVSGRPALTVHPVGNFGEALYGGVSGRLSPCAPGLQSGLLRALRSRAAVAEYAGEVTFEVTHHGPLLRTPSCFLELGSSEAQWGDEAGAAVVARALLEVAGREPPAYPTVIGLGGGHYGPRFTEAVLTGGVHVGHMIPNHAIESAKDPAALIAEAVRATPGAAGIYAHKKMLAKDVLRTWRAAAEDQAVPWLDSSAWSPLPAPRPG